MANNVKKKKIILIGPGGIAKDYAKILKAMELDVLALGRNEERCNLFEEETAMNCKAVVLEKFLTTINVNDYWFIVTVNTENLGAVLRLLISKNAKNILVEKPAGIDEEDLGKTMEFLEGKNITPFVAYNRRFYQSFQTAKRLIQEQGGLLSCHFEFTEWAHEIEKLDKTKEALANWLLGNSSHVIDVVFYIAGLPKELCSYSSGSLPWHPRGAQYCGAGITTKEVLFNYEANWESAGRWGVEFNTRQGKLILRPLEKLFFQKKGQLNVEEIKLDSDLDIKYKPGLYKQVEAFLTEQHESMITLPQHYSNVINVLQKINAKKK